jgi:hypothetical protein
MWWRRRRSRRQSSRSHRPPRRRARHARRAGGLGERRAVPMSLNNLAELARERGDFETARPLYEEALAEARLGGDQGNVALCLQENSAARAGCGYDADTRIVSRNALICWRRHSQKASD